MKEPYEEGLGSRLGPESYGGDGDIVGVALGTGKRRPIEWLGKYCEGEDQHGRRQKVR